MAQGRTKGTAMSDWQEEVDRRRVKLENARRAMWNDGRAMDRARASVGSVDTPPGGGETPGCRRR